jgi:bifunctional non-homologous end joining protein LigD
MRAFNCCKIIVKRGGKPAVLCVRYSLFERARFAQLPLKRRKEISEAAVLPDLPHIRYSDHIEEQGSEFYDLALSNGLEGIVAKDMESPYTRMGCVLKRWLKIKISRRQEAVIGGFTAPRGSRKNLGALLLGVYEEDDLVFIGHTGGGFTEKKAVRDVQRLEPLIRKTSPFKTKPQTNQPATWVSPNWYVKCALRNGPVMV